MMKKKVKNRVINDRTGLSEVSSPIPLRKKKGWNIFSRPSPKLSLTKESLNLKGSPNSPNRLFKEGRSPSKNSPSSISPYDTETLRDSPSQSLSPQRRSPSPKQSSFERQRDGRIKTSPPRTKLQQQHMSQLKKISRQHISEIKNAPSSEDDLIVSTFSAPPEKNFGDFTKQDVTKNSQSRNMMKSVIFDNNFSDFTKQDVTKKSQSQNMTKSAKIEHQRRETEVKVKVRATLGRVFNRPIGAMRWNVDVGCAEWDDVSLRWKYRVGIKDDRMRHKQVRRVDGIGGGAWEPQEVDIPLFTTTRTLQDFVWLEQALRYEYYGSLLLPLLELALNGPDALGTLHNSGLDISTYTSLEEKMDQNEQVDGHLLADWLSDVLNGLRGQGELILDIPNVDINSSESMETFLFRNTDVLPSSILPSSALPTSLPTSSYKTSYQQRHQISNFSSDNQSRSSSLGEFSHPLDEKRTSIVNCGSNDSLLKSLMKPFTCFPTMESENMRSAPIANLPLDMINCKSRATGDVMNDIPFDTNSSRIEASHPSSSQLAIHSELIEAQKELLSNYRQNTINTCEKLRDLFQEESERNVSWKLFAISLSNLFSFEKDVENARIGEKKDKSRRNLSKSDIDDGLRILARQKCDRSIPALHLLNGMLNAYVEDLSTIQPNINVYAESVAQLALWESSDAYPIVKSPSNDWKSKYFGQRLCAVKKPRHCTQGAVTSLGSSSSSQDDASTSQKRAFEDRVVTNEGLLKQSLGIFCKAVPIRVSRMAWKYFKMESGQASLLNSAAVSLKTIITATHSPLIGKKLERWQEREREDNEKELELVRKILEVGYSSRFTPSKNGSIDNEEMEKVAVLSKRAMRLAKDRVGRGWDSKMALAVMEGACVDDAEVGVEETTRDLRLVRKYAIGLRNCLDRSLEALENLEDVISHRESSSGSMSMDNPHEQRKINGHRNDYSLESLPNNPNFFTPLTDELQIKDHRDEFLSSLAVTFSGVLIESGKTKNRSASPSMSVLTSSGISVSDPNGWLGASNMEHTFKRQRQIPHNHAETKSNCGKVASDYFKTREYLISEFLLQVSQLLIDYEKRVEMIESFVYMHCVGIQLEKHFSKCRKEALSAWERKTDLTTAINIARRKRLPDLERELREKAEALGPNVSHTEVIMAKDRHLLSKDIKADLHDLASRRFQRVKDVATERVVDIIRLWADFEEFSASEELKLLGDVIREIENSVTEETVQADGGSHLFASL